MIMDLTSKTRSNYENVTLSALVGGVGKIDTSIYHKLVLRVKMELEGTVLEINGWKVNIRLVYNSLDFEMVRDLYHHGGWAAYHGCFFCYHRGQYLLLQKI